MIIQMGLWLKNDEKGVQPWENCQIEKKLINRDKCD